MQTNSKFKDYWCDADFDHAVVGAEGASGGIITIWNKDFLNVEEVITSKNFICIRDYQRGLGSWKLEWIGRYKDYAETQSCQGKT